MSVASIVGDVKARAAFVAAQAAMGLDVALVLRNQAHAVVAKLHGKQLTLEGATEVTQAVMDGPWDPAHRVMVSTALAACVAASDHVPVHKGPRCQQHSPNIEDFLTADDYEMLASDSPLQTKISTVCIRIHRLGAGCPCERLLGRIAGIVGVVAFPDAAGLDQPSRKSILDQVRANIKRLDKHDRYPYVHEQDLPVTPAELPAHKAEYAYPSGFPAGPIHPRLAHLNQYLDETASRTSHKSLRPSRPAAASASTADIHASVASMLAPLVQMFTGHSPPALLSMQASPPHNRFQPQATPLLALGAALPLVAGAVAPPLALTDAFQMPPPALASVALPPHQPFAHAPTDALAVAEDAMRAAAALRKETAALKKPAAATLAPDDDLDNEGEDVDNDWEGDDLEEAPPKKTAPKCARLGKKPAAALVPMLGKKPAAAFAAPTRGAHTSRAYDATVRDLKRKGYSDDDVKTKGRAAYQRAAREWDAGH
jgi:hypothetical protein